MKKIITETLAFIFVICVILWDQSYVPPEMKLFQNQTQEINEGKFLSKNEPLGVNSCFLRPNLSFDYLQENKYDISYWLVESEQKRLEIDTKLKDEINLVIPQMENVMYLGINFLENGSSLFLWRW